MDTARYDRLEKKIDKLTDAVTAIARVEEKILASNMRLDRAEFRLDKQEEDLDVIEEVVRSNSGVVRFADKAFWIVVGLVGSVIAWFLKNGVGG